MKYALRTVQLHATTLRQILLWAWMKRNIDGQITVVTKRSKGKKGYVNNRRTPTLRTCRSPQLRKSCEIRGIEPFTVYGLRRLRVDTLQRQGIEPAVYERIMGHSMWIAQEIYRTTNDADLQGTLVSKADESSKDGVKTEVLLAGLIGKLGLSLEEALVRLMG